MGDSNKYLGYIKLPNQKAAEQTVWLAFNSKSEMQDGKITLHGFYLRMFADKDPIEEPLDGPEISVYLRPEEWLDLTDAMKHEYERHDQAWKDFEKGRSTGEADN